MSKFLCIYMLLYNLKSKFLGIFPVLDGTLQSEVPVRFDKEHEEKVYNTESNPYHYDTRSAQDKTFRRIFDNLHHIPVFSHSEKNQV